MSKLTDRAKKLKNDIPAVFLALKEKRTPWYAKMIATVIVVYALSPIDLIPDFIPVLGYLFSTVTTSKEKIRVYLTLEAEVLDTAHPVNLSVGTLKQIKTTSRKGF